jgi:hypothetical protein
MLITCDVSFIQVSPLLLDICFVSFNVFLTDWKMNSIIQTSALSAFETTKLKHKDFVSLFMPYKTVVILSSIEIKYSAVIDF